MFSFNNELAALFTLPHGFKASGEDSVWDGVYSEAQLQSLGVAACQHLRVAQPWVAHSLLPHSQLWKGVNLKPTVWIL